MSENIIEMKNIIKKYKSFELNIPSFGLPKGFSTAFIGENGAGKTTLLDIMAGINLDYKGEVNYFGEYNNVDDGDVRERIGYTAANNYFMPHWKLSEVAEISGLLFDRFDKDKFKKICNEFSLWGDDDKKSKTVAALSDGNKMRLMLASVLARETDVLIMDEPASPLDPVMRDMLCDKIREYISEGGGEKSVLFSTHNISDMENAADYVIFMSNGKIVEKGFVEDLKEKYIIVRDDIATYERTKQYLLTKSKNATVYSGLSLAENRAAVEEIGAAAEIPNLQQLSIEILKLYENK